MSSSEDKARVVFVDDEPRVLNSMRVMFRRQYELFLANSGAEALAHVRDNPVDVVVADQRMPGMQGVEVLSAVKSLSPGTVRILLTGYADLDAIEGSINEGEVYRFLTKPCAPQQLRDTLEHAARVARDVPPPSLAAVESPQAHATAAPRSPVPAVGDDGERTTDLKISAKSAPYLPASRGRAVRTAVQPMSVAVLTSDEALLATVRETMAEGGQVHHAVSLVKLIDLLEAYRPGVLVTDVSSDPQTLQRMTQILKRQLPELVTIVVSEHRDAQQMISLINEGQVFRYLCKPLSPGRCAVSVNAAYKHHRLLLEHPQLNERHRVSGNVDGQAQESGVESLFDRIRALGRLWRRTNRTPEELPDRGGFLT